MDNKEEGKKKDLSNKQQLVIIICFLIVATLTLTIFWIFKPKYVQQSQLTQVISVMQTGFSEIKNTLDKQKQHQDSINNAEKIILDHFPNLSPIAQADIKGISSKFGDMRKDTLTGKVEIHSGTDFRVDIGTQVMAAASGIVELAKRDDGWGNRVLINHQIGFETSYNHLSKMLVIPGEIVHKGQIIALSGNTGISTGPHLDFRLYYHGKPLNSNLFLI